MILRTRGEREFRAFWPSFLGVLVPGIQVLGVASQGVVSRGVASSGPGGFRLTRLLRVVAGELWLAGYFTVKGIL